jgi:Ser/Thr protein kinase RdoA (MazF antagonist)
VFQTGAGPTWANAAGRIWELTEWMPGKADFCNSPTRARLQSACRALARVHKAWEKAAGKSVSPCPAVQRRLDCLRDWKGLKSSGWDPRTGCRPTDPLRDLIERASHYLTIQLPAVSEQLRPWVPWRNRVQPCLCDVWHDNLLFTNDQLVGLVDYGSAKSDHVAVDLARLLGSLVKDDEAGWKVGLDAYRSERPFSLEEEELAHVLDRTGTVLAITTWLRWLLLENREIENRDAVGRRLADLLERRHFN